MRVLVMSAAFTAILTTGLSAQNEDRCCTIQSMSADAGATNIGHGVGIDAIVANSAERSHLCLVRIVVWEKNGGEWRNPTRPVTRTIRIAPGETATAHIGYVPGNATQYKAVAELFGAPGEHNGGEKLGEAECYFGAN